MADTVRQKEHRTILLLFFDNLPMLSYSYPEQFQLTTSPAILIPSSLVLNGRNTFPVGNCKLSRYLLAFPNKRVQYNQ